MQFRQYDVPICQLLQRRYRRAGTDTYRERPLLRDRGVCQLFHSIHNEITDGACEDVAFDYVDMTAVGQHNEPGGGSGQESQRYYRRDSFSHTHCGE